MTVGTNGVNPEPGPEAGIDELQADIERTRAELGATVGALADKMDVKTQVQETVAETKQAAVQRVHEVQQAVRRNPRADAAVVLAAAVTVGLIIWLRNRNR